MVTLPPGDRSTYVKKCSFGGKIITEKSINHYRYSNFKVFSTSDLKGYLRSQSIYKTTNSQLLQIVAYQPPNPGSMHEFKQQLESSVYSNLTVIQDQTFFHGSIGTTEEEVTMLGFVTPCVRKTSKDFFIDGAHLMLHRDLVANASNYSC
ncbi:hypothetical protein QTP88_012815 [Uroleucon formosanum]